MIHRYGKRAFVATMVMALALSAVPLVAQNQGAERYMIQFRSFGPDAAAAVRAAGGSPVHQFEDLRVVAAWLPEQALNGLRNHPNVEFIEEDPKRELFAQTTPYGIALTQANQLVFQGSNADGCKVCIIDSGYQMSHEDLQNTGVTWTNDSGTGNALEDGCGHGTHVAGTVAALNNSVGVVGVVGNGAIKLHIEKVFGNDCSWRYSSDLIAAVNRCRNAGSKIISMSLGGGRASVTEENAFKNANAAGVLSIAAAGNDGSTRKSYPASYPVVMSVAALDSNKQHASFSQRNDAVEIAAPGVSVLSTVPWKSSNVVVDGSTYFASDIDGSARVDRSGATVNGGLCLSSGSWSGRVVICERGQISFADKVNNVRLGGGVAAVIYNNVSGGFAGTLNGSSTIPAVSVSREDGLEMVSSSKIGKTAAVNNSAGSGSGYEAWDGTSMATPHVSGIAALLWSHFPNATNTQIRNAMNSTAEDLGPAGRDNSYGWGLVQAKAAYEALGGTGGGGGEEPPPGGGDDPPPPPPPGDAPVISGVQGVSTHHRNGNFEIRWTTDIPATSQVEFTGGASGTFSNDTLKTSHAMSFKGTRGVTYTFVVRSTANGKTAESGPHTFVNQ
jgi:serine protease